MRSAISITLWSFCLWLAIDGLPFLRTFLAISIIYLLGVVRAERETREGIDTAWRLIERTLSMAMGIGIFLVMRYVAAVVVGIYPIDTYEALNSGGILKGILPGRGVPIPVAFEVLFAMVGGQVTYLWARAKNPHKMPVRIVIVVALLFVGLQKTVPNYTATLPTWQAVGTNLVQHGWLGASAKGARVLLFGQPTPKAQKTTATSSVAPATQVAEERLVLVYEGITPCSTWIGYRAQIWGSGPDFLVRFPGVTNPVLYSRGHYTAPDGVTFGETVFTAADPAKPVNIQVLRKITVRK